MTRHSEFKMETRRYGDGYSNFVQIECGWCHYEAWFPAKNGGWAMRIFRAHGWKVGSKPSQHRCPTCFGKAMASRRIPDNPVIPKELGKMLKKTIVEAHVRDALLGSSVLTPKGANAMPRMADDDTRSPEARAVAAIRPVPPTPQPAPAPVPEPAAVHPKPIRGRPSKPGVTQFTRRDNAARSGTEVTGSVDGVEFYTLPLGDGWTWKYAADVTDEEKIVWRQSRKHGPVVKQASRARMAALQPPQPQEEPTVTVVPIQRKDPMPATAPEIVAPMADPARQPTRDERQLIHDELTKHYNIVDQRYDGQDSDTNVSGRLNLPRAWVTSVREMFFGEYDRNQTSEKRKAAMSEAIALAGAATKRLLEMAAEAETIEANLVAALNKLEG